MFKRITIITTLAFSISPAPAAPPGAADVLPDDALVFISVSDAGAFADEVYASPLFGEEPASTEDLTELFEETGTDLTFEELIAEFGSSVAGDVGAAVYDGARFGRGGEVDEYGEFRPVVRMVLVAEMPPDRADYEPIITRIFDALEDSVYEERDGDLYRKRKVDVKHKKGHGFEYAAVKITEETEIRYAPDNVNKSKEVKDLYIGDDGDWFVMSDEERIFEHIKKTARGSGRLSDDEKYLACTAAVKGPSNLVAYVNMDRLAAVAPEFAEELRPSEYDDGADRFLKGTAGDVRAFVFASSFSGSGPAEKAFAYIPDFAGSDYAPLFGEPTEFKGPGATPAGFGVYAFYSSGGFAEMLESDSFRSISGAGDEFGEDFAAFVDLLDTNAPDLLPSLGGEFVLCYREGAGAAAENQDAYFPDVPDGRYLFITELNDPDGFNVGLRQLTETAEDITVNEYDGPAGARFMELESEGETYTLAAYGGWVYASPDEAEVENALKEVTTGNLLSDDPDFVENAAHLSPEQSILIYIDYPALVAEAETAETPTALDMLLRPVTLAVKTSADGVLYEADPSILWQVFYSSFVAGSTSIDY
jgi:hypothetical protein